MGWKERHPRLHAVGGVAMLVGGILSSISGAWQLYSSEPLIPFLARVALPSLTTKVVVLVVGVAVAVVGGVLLRSLFKATRHPVLGPQTPTPELKIPNRREALETAKVAWGLWHTGHRNRIDRLLGLESLSRILILNPDANSSELDEVARRSGETIERLVSQIQDTTRDALKHKKQVKWYSPHRESSFTIVDTTPIEENGILKPHSENAWMCVEYLNPDVGVDQRQGRPIYNRGKQKSLFMGFYGEYEDIWENRSQPAISAEKDSDTKQIVEELLAIKGYPEKPVYILRVLYHDREKLTEGLYSGNATPLDKAVYHQLDLHGIVRLEQRKERIFGSDNTRDVGYWVLTERGKEVIKYLQKNQQVLHSEDSQTE